MLSYLGQKLQFCQQITDKTIDGRGGSGLDAELRTVERVEQETQVTLEIDRGERILRTQTIDHTIPKVFLESLRIQIES
jgi:hypothetical protein